MAGKLDRAFPAIFWESVELSLTELTLLLGCNQLVHALVADIPQKIFWFHKMVAGIQIAVVFQRQRVATGGVENTDAGRCAQPVCQR